MSRICRLYPSLSLTLIVWAGAGCAHRREAHYPSSNGLSEPALTTNRDEINAQDTRSASKGNSRSSSDSKRSSTSQARLDSNNDTERFEIGQFRD
jgi:hypothetical protein